MHEPDPHTLAFAYALPHVPRLTPLDNDAYHVDTPMGDFSLQVFEGSDSLAQQRYLHWVLLSLGAMALSFTVPTPLRDKQGGTLHRRPDGDIWILSQWLTGETIQPNDPDHAYAVGAALAELHTATAKMQPLPPPDSQTDPAPNGTAYHALPTDPAELGLGETPESLHRTRRFSTLARSLREHAPRPSDDLRWHIIHGDFFAPNLLYNGDRIVGVMNFTAARPDFRVREFAETLARIASDRGVLFWGTARSFVEGYASSGNLTRAEIELVPRFIVARQVEAVLYYAGRQPALAARALTSQEEISAWLEGEGARLQAMLRGVFLGE